MNALCKALWGLFRSAADLPANAKLGDPLCEICGRLAALDKQLGKVVVDVAFVGKTNVGKSTLINALFGEEVAPRRNGPFTATVVEYRYSPKYSILLKYQDEPLAELEDCDTADELYTRLMDETTVGDVSDFARAEKIIVGLPSELLKSNIVIYDTPGLGATTGMSENDAGIHDDIVKEVLAAGKLDQIILVFRGDNPTMSELNFLKTLRHDFGRRLTLLVNVNDGDDADEEFQAQYVKKYLRGHRGIRDRLRFINAKSALEKRSEDLSDTVREVAAGTRNCQLEAVVEILNQFVAQCRAYRTSVRWKTSQFYKVLSAAEKINDKNLSDVVAKLKNLDPKII